MNENKEAAKRAGWAMFVESDVVNFFREHELEKLKASLDEMNAGEMNRTVDLLLNSVHPPNIRKTISEISALILKAEYDEAKKLIDSLLM